MPEYWVVWMQEMSKGDGWRCYFQCTCIHEISSWHIHQIRVQFKVKSCLHKKQNSLSKGGIWLELDLRNVDKRRHLQPTRPWARAGGIREKASREDFEVGSILYWIVNISTWPPNLRSLFIHSISHSTNDFWGMGFGGEQGKGGLSPLELTVSLQEYELNELLCK